MERIYKSLFASLLLQILYKKDGIFCRFPRQHFNTFWAKARHEYWLTNR